jgi:hypothetical protein
MNKQIEALKMAIEVLSQDEGWFDPSKAINACKEALAEAENPELVAVQYLYKADKDNPEMIPLYTHPAIWQSLSDDEIEYLECLKAPPVHPDFINDDSWYEFARAIEQALKEKNHA